MLLIRTTPQLLVLVSWEIREIRYVLAVEDLQEEACGLWQRNGRACDGLCTANMIFRKRTEILSGRAAVLRSYCRTFRRQQNALCWTDDLGCVLGLNLYRALGNRNENDCANDDVINITSCKTHTHKIYMYTCVRACVCMYIYVWILILVYIHYIALHYNYIVLRYITLHYVTLQYITLCYVTLQYIMLNTLITIITLR